MPRAPHQRHRGSPYERINRPGEGYFRRIWTAGQTNHPFTVRDVFDSDLPSLFLGGGALGTWVYANRKGKRRGSKALRGPETKIQATSQETMPEVGGNPGADTSGVPRIMGHGRLAQGIPDYFTTRLRYARQAKYVLEKQFAADQDFRLNGIYDVDGSLSTAQQPPWRDQWAALYTHYRVLETRIHVRVENTINETMFFCGLVQRGTSLGGLYGRPERFKMSKHGFAIELGQALSGDDNILHWSYTYKPESITSRPEEESNTIVWCPIGANPVGPDHHLLLHYTNFEGTVPGSQATGINCLVSYELEYVVQFRGYTESVDFGGVTGSGETTVAINNNTV